MKKAQAIKKYEEWNRKHVSESAAVHEAGHMFVNKKLFSNMGEWVYKIGPMGQPFTDLKVPSSFDINSNEMLVKVLHNRIAGVVSEAYYYGLADNAMDVLEHEVEKYQDIPGTDEFSTLELLEAYYRENGKYLNIRSEVAKVLSMFRSNKDQYMAEVHNAKRFFKDYEIGLMAC